MPPKCILRANEAQQWKIDSRILLTHTEVSNLASLNPKSFIISISPCLPVSTPQRDTLPWLPRIGAKCIHLPRTIRIQKCRRGTIIRTITSPIQLLLTLRPFRILQWTTKVKYFSIPLRKSTASV